MAPPVARTDKMDDKPMTVLVTGFAPWRDEVPINPSYEIAKRLPNTLPRTDHLPPVTIHRHDPAIRVSYDLVRRFVPRLMTEHEDVDLVLHIGLCSGETAYLLERNGSRGPYSVPDIDGRVPAVEEPDSAFGDCPPVLSTSLPHADVLARWRGRVSSRIARDIEVEGNEDADRFLCDYLYFNSLAWWDRRLGRPFGGTETVMHRPVLFLHVPEGVDEDALRQGSDVVIELIRAVQESLAGPEPESEPEDT